MRTQIDISIGIQKMPGNLAMMSNQYITTLLHETTLNCRVINRSLYRYISYNNLIIGIYYLKNVDLPLFVDKKIIDVAIIGSDLFFETHDKYKKLYSIKKLSGMTWWIKYASTRVNYVRIKQAKRIATTFPNIATSYLRSIGNFDAKIIKISGSVEVMPFLKIQNDYIDGIIDVVQTGMTVASNDLRLDKKVIGRYYPMIIGNCSNIKNMVLQKIFGETAKKRELAG